MTRAGIAAIGAALASGFAAGWLARGAAPDLLARLSMPGPSPSAAPEKRCATEEGGLMICVHRVRIGRDEVGKECVAADLTFVNLRRQGVTNICDTFVDARGRKVDATVPMVAGLAPTDETEGSARLCGLPRSTLESMRFVECHGLGGGRVSVPLPPPGEAKGRKR